MTDDERQLAAVVAGQAALIAALEARLQIEEDFAASVTEAIGSAGIMKTKQVLKVAKFDFAGSEAARTEMMRNLQRSADAKQALTTILSFAKIVAPLILI